MEAGLAGAAPADDQHVFVDVILGVLIPAQHDALCLGQKDVPVKLRIDIGADIFCVPP